MIRSLGVQYQFETQDAERLPALRRFARVYTSPFPHCPAFCPFAPPPVLFADDYDSARYEAVWAHCQARCPLGDNGEPPCLRRYRGW